jgi:hypothetical protein
MWGKGVDNVEQATRIASVSVGENPICVADPSIFKHDGGPSINDQLTAVFTRYKHPAFKRADNDRISGWSQIRQRLVAKPQLLYIFATCPYLLETLPSMSIDKQKPEDLDTKGNDHACLTGDTLVVTDIGLRQIRHLCNGTSVNVLAHDGYFHIAYGAPTRKNAKVIKIIFDDDTEIVCTADHKFMVADGTFKEAHCLTSADLIRCVTYGGRGYFRDSSRVQRGKILPLRALFFVSAKARSWLKTIAQKSLGIFQWRNSQGNAHPSQGWEQSQQSDRKLRIARLKDAFEPTHDAGETSAISRKHSQNCCADGKILAQKSTGQGVAFGTCKADCCGNANDNQKLRVVWSRVSDQKAHGLESEVLSPELQNESTTKKIKSISYSQAPQDVYCLNVPTASTFVLDNGVVSHNCDALRYLCKERLIDSKWEQPSQVFNKGLVKLQSYIAQVRSQQGRARI